MNSVISHLSAWVHRETALLENGNTLLILSILVLTGFVFTKLSAKIKLPSVTGKIIGGIIIGHYVLNIFPESAYEGFTPITNFVLGLIGLSIGSHLDFRKLHNSGKRIIWITLVDILCVIPLVFTGLYYVLGVPVEVALFVSIIASATAPGSILHVVKEKRAKGIFTKTLLAVVALNNVIVILLFYSVYYFLLQRNLHAEFNVGKMILQPFIYLFESLLDGGGIGLALILFTERKKKIHASFPTMVLLALIITVGISESFRFSGLLSSLILGMIITNFSKYKEDFFSAFHDLEDAIYALFFVLAGTHFDFHALLISGVAGIIMIVARFVGKSTAPVLGAVFANSTKTITQNIGIAMYPLAGLAIGLTLFVENSVVFKGISSSVTAIVLSAVVVYELIGPIFTGQAIKRSGEVNKDRLRLLDFLQEEFIKIDLQAKDKWSALEELSHFMHVTHNIQEISQEDLVNSVKQRENEISTGIGNGIAIPHAVIEGGPNIRGVIATVKDGIDFEALDNKPVNIIILIATPKSQYKLHLQALATIAKIFGHHSHIKEMIVHADSPEEVFEILQREEVDKLNHFFED